MATTSSSTAASSSTTLAFDPTLPPDAVNILDVFASLQNNSDVVSPGSSTPTASSNTPPSSTQPPTPSSTTSSASPTETSSDSSDEETEIDAYLVDVEAELPVQVQTMAQTDQSDPDHNAVEDQLVSESNETKVENNIQVYVSADARVDHEVTASNWASEESDDSVETNEAQSSDESWVDAVSDEEGSDEDGSYDEDASYDDGSYDESSDESYDEGSQDAAWSDDAEVASEVSGTAYAGDQIQTKALASASSQNQVDWSWLGPKFAHHGATSNQADVQVSQNASDYSAEDYTDVEVAGQVDAQQDPAQG